MNTQIPVEILVRQLQQIPGLSVSAEPGGFQSAQVAGITFEDWAHRWLFAYKQGIVKDNTFNSTYREPIELHLIPYFGQQPLTAVTPIDVQLFFKSLKDELAYETLKKIRNALRLIYEAAIECNICYFNPVSRSLQLVSNVKPIKKNTWTAEEYATAYQFALQHPFGLDIITLMETAMSRSELLGLRWENHDSLNQILYLENGLVSQKSSTTGLYELVSSGLKNEYRHRAIPLSPLLNGLLSLKSRTVYVPGNKKKNIAAKTIHTQFIFHAPDGGAFDPTNWYKRVLKRFMSDLQEAHPEVRTLTTHELRHTRATLLKDEGTDLFSIARLLGHCNLKMLTKRYAHDNVEALRVALKVEQPTNENPYYKAVKNMGYSIKREE